MRRLLGALLTHDPRFRFFLSIADFDPMLSAAILRPSDRSTAHSARLA